MENKFDWILLEMNYFEFTIYRFQKVGASLLVNKQFSSVSGNPAGKGCWKERTSLERQRVN